MIDAAAAVIVIGSTAKGTMSPRSKIVFADIERQCVDALDACSGYKVLVTAMGATGMAVVKRLWGQYDDVFFLDFGSLLDAICGFKKDGAGARAWVDISGFDKDKFLEMLK